jgi:hypothetical protein
VVRVTQQAADSLRPGEVLVFDWHRVAICCASAGEVSLRTAPRDRIDASDAFHPLASDPAAVVYAHRLAVPHLAVRDITVDCRRPLLGIRRFHSDLPQDFGLRAVLGRLPASSAKEEPS